MPSNIKNTMYSSILRGFIFWEQCVINFDDNGIKCVFVNGSQQPFSFHLSVDYIVKSSFLQNSFLNMGKPPFDGINKWFILVLSVDYWEIFFICLLKLDLCALQVINDCIFMYRVSRISHEQLQVLWLPLQKLTVITTQR